MNIIPSKNGICNMNWYISDQIPKKNLSVNIILSLACILNLEHFTISSGLFSAVSLLQTYNVN